MSRVTKSGLLSNLRFWFSLDLETLSKLLYCRSPMPLIDRLVAANERLREHEPRHPRRGVVKCRCGSPSDNLWQECSTAVRGHGSGICKGATESTIFFFLKNKVPQKKKKKKKKKNTNCDTTEQPKSGRVPSSFYGLTIFSKSSNIEIFTDIF